MTRILILLGRMFVMLAGFMAACLAASAFLHVLVLANHGFRPDQAAAFATASLIFSIPFIALFIGYFAFLPAVLVMGVGEVLGRRDWLTYAIGGAAAGLAVAAIFWQASAPIADGIALDGMSEAALDPTLSSPFFYAMMVGGGIVGGIAYWLVAGRLAGGWRRPSPTSPAR